MWFQYTEGPAQPNACRLCADSDGERGGKRKLRPNRTRPCPRVAGRTGVGGAAARSVLAATHYHASGAVQEIFCSGRCSTQLPAMRASVDAHGSWASATASEKNSIT